MISQILSEVTERDLAFLEQYRELYRKAHRKTVRFQIWGAVVAVILIAAMILGVTILLQRIDTLHLALCSGFTGTLITFYIIGMGVHRKYEQMQQVILTIMEFKLLGLNPDIEFAKDHNDQLSRGSGRRISSIFQFRIYKRDEE